MAYPGYRPQYPPTPTGLRPPNPPNEARLATRPPRDSQPKRSEEGNDDHPIHRPSLSLINQSPAPFALYTPSALSLQPRPSTPAFPILLAPHPPSHFSLLPSSSALLPGLFNHRCIGIGSPRAPDNEHADESKDASRKGRPRGNMHHRVTNRCRRAQSAFGGLRTHLLHRKQLRTER